MSQDHLVENKSLYMKEKSELSLQECFERCNKGANDYKTVTNRHLTCIGTPPPTQNTAPPNSITPTPTPSTSSRTEASTARQRQSSSSGPSSPDHSLLSFLTHTSPPPITHYSN